MSAIEIPETECALQLEGTPPIENLREMQRLYNGPKGAFAYHGYTWLNCRVWEDRLPVPLIQWALTPYGGCLGMTRSFQEQLPVITLHPAIWSRTPGGASTGWAAHAPAGPRYTLDVIIHELIHVEVDYLLGGTHGEKSSHDNPKWCAAIERVAERLKGTTLELPPFRAQPTERIREHGRQLRRTPPGCISMDECSRWPGSIRVPSYFREQDVPFIGAAEGAA